MKIEFELTKRDYIEFNMNYILNSNLIKRSFFIQQFIIPIIFLITPFVFAAITDLPIWVWLVPFIIVYILWVLLYPKYFKRYTRRNIEKIINEGKNKDLFCNHSIMINDDGIIETSLLGETKSNWGAVEKIIDAKEYIFIYTSSVMAYIVPSRAFLDIADRIEFMNILKQHYNI